MSTTPLTRCDRQDCKAIRTDKTAKDWISASGRPTLLEGPQFVIFGDATKADVAPLDFCSPACAVKYTVSLLKWKTVGRPAGSRNRRKVEVAAV